jgi:hypothetical protein
MRDATGHVMRRARAMKTVTAVRISWREEFKRETGQGFGSCGLRVSSTMCASLATLLGKARKALRSKEC